MKIIAVLLLNLFCLTGIKAIPHLSDSIPVNSKDVESINAIISSLYNVISGPAGENETGIGCGLCLFLKEN